MKTILEYIKFNNIRKSLAILLVIGLVLPLFLQTFSHIIQEDVIVSKLAYYFSKILFIVLPIFYWLITHKNPIETGGTMKKVAIISGFALSIIIFLSLYASIADIKLHSEKISETLRNLGMTDNFILYSSLIIVVNSLLEELYWRYSIYNSLKEMGSKKVATIVSSTGFALMHLIYFVGLFESVPVIITLTLGSFILGVFWSSLYEKTKNILYVWINHALVNAPLFYIEYLLLFR